MKVHELLTQTNTDTVAVPSDMLIMDVIGALRKAGAGAAIVRGDGIGLDGIITERAILQALAARGCATIELPVSALATTAAVSCAPDDSISDVARLMAERRLHHVAVRKAGRLVGVVSIADLLNERLRSRRQVTRALAMTEFLCR